MAVMMTMLIRTEGKRWDTCWAVGWGVAVFVVVGRSGLSLGEVRLFFRAVLVGSGFWLWLVFVSGSRRERCAEKNGWLSGDVTVRVR